MTNTCCLLHLPLPSTISSVSVNLHTSPTSTDIGWSKCYFHYRLKMSKTDQLHHGQTIYLPCSRGPICPYADMKTYLTHSTASRRPFPLSVFSALNRSSCLKHLRYLLKTVGYNPKYHNTHSFSIGAATPVAQTGLSRWRSMAYQRYIHSNKIHKQLAVEHLALSQY